MHSPSAWSRAERSHPTSRSTSLTTTTASRSSDPHTDAATESTAARDVTSCTRTARRSSAAFFKNESRRTPAVAISLSEPGGAVTLVAEAPIERKPRRESLAELIVKREPAMVACETSEWLSEFADVPGDAAAPLAMSPRHPRAVGSYGAQCIAWIKVELGVTLRWWQALAVTRQLEHDADGALVWRELVETGPRRIGKSVRLRAVALWRIAHADLIGEKQLSMLVSKDLAVGKEIHRGAWGWAEAPHRREAGWKVTRLNGGQEVEGPDESRWLLRADTAVYGYDVGYGQVDESWGVDPQAISDGLEPALLERIWPQLHLTSTAHVKATSLMRRRLLAALRNDDPDVLLLFWGAHPLADLSHPETWRAASPHWTADREALVRRKYIAAAAGEADPEFDDPDPVRGWASQYLNVWPLLDTQGAGVLPTWIDCELDVEPPPLTAIGIAVSLNAEWGSIASADLWPGEDKINLSAVDRRPGTAWIVAEALRIKQEYGCSVAIDEKCPDATLIPALREAGVNPTVMTLDDYIEAWSDLVNRVRDKTITHQGTTDLDTAIAVAGLRSVGDGRRVPGRVKSSGDIDMLEAAICAAREALLNSYDPLDSIG
ncbi:hypothetical protein [Pimelobacter simplex]|uniref:hypothetical protein n=1 Tax=Nocardioides simplex TaxID=2045 RepID=UPI003AAC1F02